GIGILLGQGGGTFAPMLHYGATGLPFAVAAGDFNGDGFIDLAVAGEHGGSAGVLHAAGWLLASRQISHPPLPPPGGGGREPLGGLLRRGRMSRAPRPVPGAARLDCGTGPPGSPIATLFGGCYKRICGGGSRAALGTLPGCWR